jgi:hypothetical protein
MATGAVDPTDVKIEMKDENNTIKEPLKFTQAEGLQKTYAHYLLFKDDSPTLSAVIGILVPNEKQNLFKEIFKELNKKHVSAGLKQFAPNFVSAKIETWDIQKYGITYNQYAEMRKYAELLSVKFGADKMEKEIYENKPQIDLIHEAVIQYFPIDGATTKDKEIVNNARENLQMSLKEGYIGKRNSYIKPTEQQPAKIGAIQSNIDTIKEVFDKLPNVLHLEAVAELHRRAFLSVDQKDALEVIANAHSPPTNDYKPTTPTTKTLYVKKDINQYMVSSIQMNTEFEKYVNGGGCWKKEGSKKKGGTKQKSKKARSK